MRQLVFIFSIFILITSAFAGEKPFSPKPYLDDYLALREHVSQSYANLEDLLKFYNINPYDLNEKTIKAINISKADGEANAVLNQFVKTFNDGHFQLKKPDSDNSKTIILPNKVDNTADGEVACKAMGFTWDKVYAFRFPIVGAKIIKKSEGEFPSLVVEKEKIKIGLIRISDFRSEVYPKTCIEVWGRFARTLKSLCTEKCLDDFLYKEMRKALVDKFYAVLVKVRKYHPKAILIDLTHNGGGTDWVTDITALLTNKELVCGRRGFIKHPHYVKIFTDELNDLKAAPKPDLKKVKELESKVKLASEVCDRTPLWTKKDFKLNCSAVAYSEGDSCKYSELRFPEKRKYDGKLFFLVDDHTASAAEDIVARHLDSKTATIIGSRTYGSGCGYMNGGIKFTLPNTGLKVLVPDCIRERADGTNEVLGIEPQVRMDMSKVSEPAFLSQLVEAMRQNL